MKQPFENDDPAAFRSRLDRFGRPEVAPRHFVSWHWGHRQKVRRLMSSFANYSSLHGVHYICSGDRKFSRAKRIFYRVFFAGCVLATLSNVAFVLQESLSSESVYISSTSKEGATGPDEDPFFPRYPRITLCRKPGYRIDANSRVQELLEYAYLSLGHPYTPFTPRERSHLFQILTYVAANDSLPEKLVPLAERMNRLERVYDELKDSTEDFNLTHFILENSASCEDVFSRCVLFIKEVDCCKIFQQTLTALGVCYSALIEAVMLDIQADFENPEFIVDLWAAPALEKGVEIGYEIHMSDPRNKEVAFSGAGQSLINGFMTVQRTTVVKTSRVALHTPWHTLGHSCPRLPDDLDLMGYGDRYFKSGCEKRYLDKMMRDSCKCRYVTDQCISDLRQCDPVDAYGCFILTAMKDNLTDMKRVCRPPCLEYRYESSVNFVKLGIENISRLMLIYDGTQYTLKEYRTTTISSLLSQVGGVLGLYLGASVITALELLNFLTSWIWYWILPHRRIQTPVIQANALVKPKRKTTKDLYFY